MGTPDLSPGTTAAEADRELLVLSGPSGSGKTLALRAFEDSGFFCIDNLPVTLIPVFADLCDGSRHDIKRAAVVVDIREGTLLKDFPEIFRRVRAEPGRRARLIFFDSDDETLMRRFSETRRPHPLAGSASLEEGIRRERALLQPLRDMADLILDSSRFNVHQMRRYIQEQLAPQSGVQPMAITILSFGYKHGVPPESDLMFDTRFLPNPFFVEGLRALNGRDREVQEYLQAIPEFAGIRSRVIDLLLYLIPQYIREGKSYLTASIGCTGGRHRSVALAEAVAADLRERGYAVIAAHRDLEKE